MYSALAALVLAGTARAQSLDLLDAGIVLPLGDPGSLHEHNVGSPSVIYDPDAAQFVMFFEYRGAWGDPPRCADSSGTTWGIGRATSPDGLTWDVDPDPVLEPEIGSFFECAAVHPHLVYEGPGQWHLWFKAFQEAGKVCDGTDDPAWGCRNVTGVGYASSTDSITWTVQDDPVLDVAAYDPTPEDFGWPRVVQVSGTWLMLMNYGNNGVTLATASHPAGPWSWEGMAGNTTLPIGEPPWMEDELIVADVTCNDESEPAMLDLFFGGHDRADDDFWGVPLSRSLGYAQGVNLDDWSVQESPVRDWSQDDILDNTAWRSWTALPLGHEHWIVYYQRMVDGGNQVGLATTQDPESWDLSSIRGDFCTFDGLPPQTEPDEYELLNGVTLVSEPSVLANDVDPERNPITAALVAEPAAGSVTLEADGSFVYTAPVGFVGEDTFTYTASDASSSSAPTLVTIEVEGGEAVPVAVPDAYQGRKNRRLFVPGGRGLLANDDWAGHPRYLDQWWKRWYWRARAIVVEPPRHGRLNLDSDGSFSYTPDRGFAGEDTFTYRLESRGQTSAPATVTIDVKEWRRFGSLRWNKWGVR